MTAILDRVLGSIDIDTIVRDVMSKLVIAKLEMYFVVQQLHDSDHYDLLGMTYSEAAAKKLAAENKKFNPRIVKFNMGKLLKLVEEMGAIEEIE